MNKKIEYAIVSLAVICAFLLGLSLSMLSVVRQHSAQLTRLQVKMADFEAEKNKYDNLSCPVVLDEK